MGQDVASIGLRHDLPVDDPYELLRVIAKRMNRNVKLVVRKEYRFFFELMMITSLPDYMSRPMELIIWLITSNPRVCVIRGMIKKQTYPPRSLCPE